MARRRLDVRTAVGSARLESLLEIVHFEAHT